MNEQLEWDNVAARLHAGLAAVRNGYPCAPLSCSSVDGLADSVWWCGTGDEAWTCLANQRVQNEVCVACPADSTNDANDDAYGGVDTYCDCGAGRRVLNNACVPCPPGTDSNSQDPVPGADTTCTAITCGPHQHVVDNACAACPDGHVCDGNTLVECTSTADAPKYIASNECTNCTAGHTCDGHAATPCDATKYVKSNECLACPTLHTCNGTA